MMEKCSEKYFNHKTELKRKKAKKTNPTNAKKKITLKYLVRGRINIVLSVWLWDWRLGF